MNTPSLFYPDMRLLPNVKAAHALWHYFSNVTYQLDKYDKGIKLEGVPTPRPVPFNFLRSTCIIYGLEPKDLEPYWEVVNKQAMALGIPVATNEVLYPRPSQNILS